MTRVRTVRESGPATDRAYTIVVAAADPDHVRQQLRTAIDVAAAKGGEIVVVSVIHKAITSPFLVFSADTIGRQYAGEVREVLETAAAIGADADVPVRRRLLVASDVSDAVLDTIRDVDGDAVLLGWQHRPRPSDVLLGTTVDPVIRSAPCDVFVERVGTTADGVRSVLLPTVGGPNVAPAADLAAAVAAANGASVDVVSYVAPDADASRREAARTHVDAAVDLVEGVPVAGRVDEAAAPAERIVADAEGHDLVVLGATRERSLRRRVVGSVAATVAEAARPPVVIAKAESDGWLVPLLR